MPGRSLQYSLAQCCLIVLRTLLEIERPTVTLAVSPEPQLRIGLLDEFDVGRNGKLALLRLLEQLVQFLLRDLRIGLSDLLLERLRIVGGSLLKTCANGFLNVLDLLVLAQPVPTRKLRFPLFFGQSRRRLVEFLKTLAPFLIGSPVQTGITLVEILLALHGLLREFLGLIGRVGLGQLLLQGRYRLLPVLLGRLIGAVYLLEGLRVSRFPVFCQSLTGLLLGSLDLFLRVGDFCLGVLAGAKGIVDGADCRLVSTRFRLVTVGWGSLGLSRLG